MCAVAVVSYQHFSRTSEGGIQLRVSLAVGTKLEVSRSHQRYDLMSLSVRTLRWQLNFCCPRLTIDIAAAELQGTEGRCGITNGETGVVFHGGGRFPQGIPQDSSSATPRSWRWCGVVSPGYPPARRGMARASAAAGVMARAKNLLDRLHESQPCHRRSGTVSPLPHTHDLAGGCSP